MKIRFVLKKVGVRHFVNFFDRRSPKLGGHCGMEPYSKWEMRVRTKFIRRSIIIVMDRVIKSRVYFGFWMWPWAMGRGPTIYLNCTTSWILCTPLFWYSNKNDLVYFDVSIDYSNIMYLVLTKVVLTELW